MNKKLMKEIEEFAIKTQKIGMLIFKAGISIIFAIFFLAILIIMLGML